MNHDLSNLVYWFQANKLSLNINKTNYILFNKKHVNHDIDQDEPIIRFGNDVIEKKPFVKFLGLMIDEKLDWNQNFKLLCTKLARSVYMLKCVKKVLPRKIMKSLYYSYFNSHLVYGIELWGPNSNQSNINRLTVLQKKAVRLINNLPYNAHTNDAFIDSGFLKIPDIIDRQLLNFIYSFVNKTLPCPLLKLFKIGNEFHTYDTRSKMEPRSAKHKSAKYNNSFLHKSTTLWTQLNQTLKKSKNLYKFKKDWKKWKIGMY